MRPTTTATDAHSHPSLTDSYTADTNRGPAHTDTPPPDTHAHAGASNSDSYPAYSNTRPPDTYADSDASHTDPGSPYRYRDRGPATSAAPGAHNGAAGGE